MLCGVLDTLHKKTWMKEIEIIRVNKIAKILAKVLTLLLQERASFLFL